MLEIFGRALINMIEKELIDAAPEIEKAMLEQIGILVDQLVCYLTGKGCAVASLAPHLNVKSIENSEE